MWKAGLANWKIVTYRTTPRCSIVHTTCGRLHAERYDSIVRCWECGEEVPKPILDSISLAGLELSIPDNGYIPNGAKVRWGLKV